MPNQATDLPVRLNQYLEIREDAETGRKYLFGKIGYQTMHPDADKYTMLNMAAVGRAMAAGELLDINGDPATDGCIIETYAIVNLVTPDSAIESVATIRTLGGAAVEVPAAPVATPGSTPNPFVATQ